MRNEFGWSPFSAASQVITTYPCTPTGRPEAVESNTNFINVRWNESNGEGVGLTNLDYEVQVSLSLSIEGSISLYCWHLMSWGWCIKQL